ncbi:TRAP transporter small permease [Limnohabitans sp. JirII-29]
MTFLGAIVAMKDGAHLGSDTLVSKLSVTGQKVFLVIGHVLMLFICWLLFVGSLNQAIINWDSTSPVMEVSMGYFYACGMVLAVSGALILVDRLLRLMLGKLENSELIGVRESEEEPVDAPAPLK